MKCRILFYKVLNRLVLFRLLWVAKLLSILKTTVGIFQIVNNRRVVTPLFLVKLETFIESLQTQELEFLYLYIYI